MSTSTQSVDLTDLAEAESIVVTDNLNQELHRVEDPEGIRRIASWLADRQDGWYVPPNGVVIMKVLLNFRRDGRSSGSVGVGHKYLTTQRRGGFYQRVAAEGDRAELFELIGMVDPG